MLRVIRPTQFLFCFVFLKERYQAIISNKMFIALDLVITYLACASMEELGVPFL